MGYAPKLVDCGEKSWADRFGDQTIQVYRGIYVVCLFIGSVVNLGAIIDFTDMMFFCMAFPNMLGGFIMSNEVAADLKDYMNRLKSGAMPVYR